MSIESHPAIDSERELNASQRGRKFPVRTVLSVVLIAVLVIGALQATAPWWDHQMANIFTVLVLIISSAILVAVVWRQQKSVGHGMRFVVVLFAAIATFAGLVRFDGFSGELVPLLRFRFVRDKQALSTKQIDPSTITAIDLSLPEAVALTDSLQFLGSERDGTISRREFEIPRSVDEVKELWRIPIGEGWSSFSISHDRAVTLEQRGAEECLTCYRLADGELLWIVSHKARHENPMGGIGPRSTPTIRDGRVFAQGATGWVGCFDLATGDELWTADLLKLAGWDQTASEVSAPWGRATSPLLVNELCVVAFGAPQEPPAGIDGRGLIALDAETGDVAWTGGDDQLSYGSPTLMKIDGVEQIVATNETTISGHEIKTGKTLWSFPWPGQTNGSANCTQVMAAGENQFLIGKGYGGGSALVRVTCNAKNEYKAEAIWTSSRALKTKFTHPLIEGDVAFGLSDGTMQAVRVDDGEILWRQPRLSRSGQGQVMLVEDVLVLQNEPGPVVFIAADDEEYREHCQFAALSDRTWNIPTIAGRHLLVRNDHEAVCYLLPARK